MGDWDKIKEEIQIETKFYFRDKVEIDVKRALKLLHFVCGYQIDSKYKLDGVATKIPKAIFEVLDENTTKKNQILYFEILSKYEPFLRKILCMVDNGKYNVLISQNRRSG